MIAVVRSPGGKSDVMFCWVTMRSMDSERPAADQLARGQLGQEADEDAPTNAASVATNATGPLKNVLNITPMPITSTICSQMPR